MLPSLLCLFRSPAVHATLSTSWPYQHTLLFWSFKAEQHCYIPFFMFRGPLWPASRVVSHLPASVHWTVNIPFVLAACHLVMVPLMTLLLQNSIVCPRNLCLGNHMSCQLSCQSFAHDFCRCSDYTIQFSCRSFSHGSNPKFSPPPFCFL